MSRNLSLAEFGSVVLESNPERSYYVAAEELKSLEREYFRQGKLEKSGEAARALAECLRRIGDLQGAEEQSKRALLYFEESRSLKGVAWTQWHTGTALRQKGRYADALKYLRLSYRKAQEASDGVCVVYSLAGVAETTRIQGDYANALPQHVRALRIFRQLGDQRGIAWAYEGIGQIQKNRGLIAKSLRSYKIAEGIARASGDLRGLAWALKGIGELKSIIGEGQEGINVLLIALRIFQESGATVAQGYTEKILGDSFLRLGCIDSAVSNYVAAFDRFGRINDERGLAYVLVGLGDLHWRIALRKEAVSIYRIASKIFDVHQLAYGRDLCVRRFERAGIQCHPSSVTEQLGQVGDLLTKLVKKFIQLELLPEVRHGLPKYHDAQRPAMSTQAPGVCASVGAW